MKLPFQLWIACGLLCAQTSVLDLLNHNLPVLDSHNCHPYEGQWNDRQMPLRSGFGSGARGPARGFAHKLVWPAMPEVRRGQVCSSWILNQDTENRDEVTARGHATSDMTSTESVQSYFFSHLMMSHDAGSRTGRLLCF